MFIMKIHYRKVYNLLWHNQPVDKRGDMFVGDYWKFGEEVNGNEREDKDQKARDNWR